MNVKFGKKEIGEIKLPSVLYFDPKKDKVKDRIIGHLIVSDHNPEFNPAMEVADDSKTIVIILESPHKDEFQEISNDSGTVFKPIAAAQGPTGNNIVKHIKEREWAKGLPDGKYTIQLMNAIQYQMSCYNSILLPNNIDEIDCLLRNKMFLLFWELPKILKSFDERLKGYDATYVVNACTGGKKDLEEAINNNTSLNGHLNWNVHERLNQSGFQYNQNYFIDNHPSRWHSNK